MNRDYLINRYLVRRDIYVFVIYSDVVMVYELMSCMMSVSKIKMVNDVIKVLF